MYLLENQPVWLIYNCTVFFCGKQYLIIIMHRCLHLEKKSQLQLLNPGLGRMNTFSVSLCTNFNEPVDD